MASASVVGAAGGGVAGAADGGGGVAPSEAGAAGAAGGGGGGASGSRGGGAWAGGGGSVGDCARTGATAPTRTPAMATKHTTTGRGDRRIGTILNSTLDARPARRFNCLPDLLVSVCCRPLHARREVEG